MARGRGRGRRNQWGYVEHLSAADRAAADRLDGAFGTGEVGGNSNFEPPVHGTTGDGQEVTASFGRAGKRDGHTLLGDGHAETLGQFYGPKGAKEHDHYDGQGDGTQRDKYTGNGS